MYKKQIGGASSEETKKELLNNAKSNIQTLYQEIDKKKEPGEKLCLALESMGTTFIKLGQFLATRPDIIGEELAENLEKLQDKLPAFDTFEAKKIKVKGNVERENAKRLP